jgi:hypothetical protein
MLKVTANDIEFVLENFDDNFRCVCPSSSVRARLCRIALTGYINHKWNYGKDVWVASGVFARAIVSRRLSAILQSPIVAISSRR